MNGGRRASRAKQVTTIRSITTYAGGGGAFTGDGKLAVGAQIARPSDVSMDAKGNVYFTSTPLNLVLKVVTDGTVSIVADNGLGGAQRRWRSRAGGGVVSAGMSLSPTAVPFGW